MSRPATLLCCLSLLAATTGACASNTSEDPSESADNAISANGASECNPLTVRAAPLAAPIALLDATGNIPLPALQADREGFFYPPPGYTEGGTFRLATAKAAWVVDPREIAPRAAPGTVRMAQWNVERGGQLDKSVRLMKKINADVWTINESDLYGTNSGGVVVARELAKALGYSYYTAIEFYERRDDRRGTSGNSILSRFPIEIGRTMDIPILADKGGHDWSLDKAELRCGSRNAMAARIAFPNATGGSLAVNVVAAHTENKANAAVRVAQYEAVLAELVRPGEPTIVAGDLNTVASGEGTQFREYLAAKVKKDGRANALLDCSRGNDATTWSGPGVTSIFLKLRIDWTLVQSGVDGKLDCLAGGYRVLGNDGASDHKPVVTELTVK